MDAAALEGFLTANAIGPVTVTVTPEDWFPHFFGSDSEELMLDFRSVKYIERAIDIMLRYYNSVIMIFEIAPENFRPTFYTHEVVGKNYTIVDEWCSDFLKVIALAADKSALGRIKSFGHYFLD